MKESDLSNPVWKALVLDQLAFKLNFLPANVLLSRLKIHLKNNNSPDEIEKARKEIFELYFKLKDLPNAQKDIAMLLKK